MSALIGSQRSSRDTCILIMTISSAPLRPPIVHLPSGNAFKLIFKPFQLQAPVRASGGMPMIFSNGPCCPVISKPVKLMPKPVLAKPGVVHPIVVSPTAPGRPSSNSPIIRRPREPGKPVVVSPRITPSPVLVKPVVVSPAVTPQPIPSKPVIVTPVVTPAPVAVKPVVVSPSSVSQPAVATVPVAAPAPVAGSAPSTTERYLDAFNAPAPFGDDDAIIRKWQTSSSSQKLRLAIDTPDLTMGSANLTGIGNALDNHLTGNSQNNVLDGMGGADIMAGGKGDDSYYVDNAGDKVIEQAGEGVDTVYAKVSTALSANVENLVLLDAGKPQSAVVNGVNVLVYGYPGSYQLNYNQGNAVPGFEGTCGETSVANVTMLGDQPVSEKEVVERAIKEGLCNTDSQFSDFRGASSQWDQQQLLEEFGFTSTVTNGFNAQEVARDIKAGKGVTVSVYAEALWDGGAVPAGVSTDHRITVTGVACSAATGAVTGFYIADSGRGRASDMCRFLTTGQLQKFASAIGANTITTDDPIKMRKQDINASGNELDNILVGNRGNNVLTGGRGNDLLIGGAGNDTYVMGQGDGQDVIYDHDATKANIDILKFSDAGQTNLWLSHVGNDLRINVMGTTDQVTVKDWYVGGTSGADNHIERIKTADGKTLYDSDVEKLVQAMASFAPPSATQTSWKEGQSSQGKVLLSITH